MRKLLLTLFILSNSALFSQSWWNTKKIHGNETTTTITRSINNFDQVNLSGFFEVLLIEGKEGKVTLEGEENILPYIITEVKNGALKIKTKKNIHLKTNKKITITVPFEDINAISLGGSGNIIAKKTITGNKISFSVGGSGTIKAKVKVNSIQGSIGGSGNISLQGQTDHLKCSVSGSGNIKAYDLSTSELKVSLAGSGNIQVSVKNKIKANVAGSGNIYYKGDPKYVDIKSVGSGSIIKRD